VITTGRIMFFGGLGASLAVGWLIFPALLYKHIDQPLQFSHSVHTGEAAGLPCEDCHRFGEDGRFQGIPAVSKCAECHAAALSENPEEQRLVETYVTPNVEIPWLVYSRQPENVFFSHIHHVKLAGLECERCHGPHGKTDNLRPLEVNRISGYSRDIWGRSISRVRMQPWEGMKMDDCAGCHAKQGVVDSCLDCHK